MFTLEEEWKKRRYNIQILLFIFVLSLSLLAFNYLLNFSVYILSIPLLSPRGRQKKITFINNNIMDTLCMMSSQ